LCVDGISDAGNGMVLKSDDWKLKDLDTPVNCTYRRLPKLEISGGELMNVFRWICSQTN